MSLSFLVSYVPQSCFEGAGEQREGEISMQPPDRLSARLSDLLEGSYDCPDRIVLNAFYPLGFSPGGFRDFWRKLHGDDDKLDNNHLMRMAGRFSRRLRAWAKANSVPIVYCGQGE
jgi:hypothetical protein